MIYVCVPVRNNAATIGLLLWKIRQVFGLGTREYQLLVTDDGSTDETPEVLERYQRALPLTVVRPGSPGSAAAYGALLEEAVRRSDRLKRDAAVIIPGDFRISPDGIPELLRRIESGADLAVAETEADGLPWSWRLLRRSAPWLLRPAQVPGVRDLTAGCLAVRLISARGALWAREGQPLLAFDGLAARAELVARLAASARQVAAVPLPTMAAAAAPLPGALGLALQFRRLGRTLPSRADQPPPQRAGEGPRATSRAS